MCVGKRLVSARLVVYVLARLRTIVLASMSACLSISSRADSVCPSWHATYIGEAPV